jgi:hypothetical protein
MNNEINLKSNNKPGLTASFNNEFVFEIARNVFNLTFTFISCKTYSELSITTCSGALTQASVFSALMEYLTRIIHANNLPEAS